MFYSYNTLLTGGTDGCMTVWCKDSRYPDNTFTYDTSIRVSLPFRLITGAALRPITNTRASCL